MSVELLMDGADAYTSLAEIAAEIDSPEILPTITITTITTISAISVTYGIGC
ncbi:LxmA leader domain family RiPP [Herbidospora mongoliensis]|uniref:LxmA leader domain family RiPP n=1 Tax=Herbidospora mongoliensis TaxID=688067 RepID=UPI000B0A2AD1|nr:LxmA leader domain family RiPP [Herbidospora mongoliensis]